MAISTVEQSPGGTDFNTVAALRTIQPPAIRPDNGVRAAIAGFDGLLAHPFVADACAALTQNATLRIVRHHRRKISFRLVVLFLSKALLEIAPVKSLFLQFALAAAIADGTVERVISEQEFEHRALGFLNLFALSGDDHAVRADDRA